MSYIFGQEDYDIACQQFCKVRTKLEIYSMEDRLIDIIEGTIDGGSSDITADSNVKRTFSVTVMPDDEHSINVAANSLLWIDKKIKLFVGLQTLKMTKTKWIPQGEYVLTSKNATYDAVTNQLQIDCGDKMLNLDGTENGEIYGALSLEIPAYEVVFKKSWLKEYSSFDEAYTENHNVEDLLHNDTIKSLVKTLFDNYDTYTETQKAESVKQIQMACDAINKVYKIAFGESEGDVLLLAHKTIKSVIKTLLTQYTNIKRYLIDDIGEYNGTTNYQYYKQYRKDNPLWDCVPYSETFSDSSTVASIIEKYCNLYPGYDYGFDEDGVFYVRMIPSLYEDDVVLTYKQLQDLLIPEGSENVSTDLSLIRNVCEVWGQCFDTDYYTDNCTTKDITKTVNKTSPDGSVTTQIIVTDFDYYATVSAYEKYTNGDIISIKFNRDYDFNAQLSINNLGLLSIYNDATEKPIQKGDIKAGNVYSLKYKKTYSDGKYIEKFYLLGQYQVHALCVLTNGEVLEDGTYSKEYFQKKYNCNVVRMEIIKDSPFVVQKIGERKKGYSGDIYDNIQSDSSAIEQAKYELWKNCRITDNVTITTILLPGLNTYQKLSYKMGNSDEIKQYITQSIHHDYNANTTQIQMYTFYPLYQEEDVTIQTFRISKDNCYKAGINSVEGDIVIPETFVYEGQEYIVTTVGSFASNEKITSVYIPDTVTGIDTKSFQGCKNLKNVRLSKRLKQIYSYTFDKCTRLESITIPDTVNNIGEYAFNECTNLKSVKLGRGIKNVEQYAFYKTGIEKLVVPGNIRKIETYAFASCHNLYHIDINEGVQYIGNFSFGDNICKLIFLPKSLKGVQRSSFIASGTLIYDGDLNIVVDGHVYSSKIPFSDHTVELFELDRYCHGDVSLPESFIYKNHKFTFNGLEKSSKGIYNSIRNLKLPSTIEYIEEKVFYENSKIQSIIMGDSISEIGELAFYGCRNLKEIRLSDNIEMIPERCFMNSSSLQYVNIPKNTTTIGKEVFVNTNIKYLEVSSAVNSIGENAFSGIDIVYYTGIAEGTPWGAKKIVQTKL